MALKAAHPDPFNSGSLKAKMFIIQVDNKITDAAGASDGWKICYAMSLLRGPALKWMITFVNNNGEITFDTYLQFKQRFLRRFTDPNSVGCAIERLMNLRQEKTSILKYCIKVMNLIGLANLRDQAAKAHFF